MDRNDAAASLLVKPSVHCPCESLQGRRALRPARG